MAYLAQFLPGVFEDAHFGNHYTENPRSKVDICRLLENEYCLLEY